MKRFNNTTSEALRRLPDWNYEEARPLDPEEAQYLLDEALQQVVEALEKRGALRGTMIA